MNFSPIKKGSFWHSPFLYSYPPSAGLLQRAPSSGRQGKVSRYTPLRFVPLFFPFGGIIEGQEPYKFNGLVLPAREPASPGPLGSGTPPNQNLTKNPRTKAGNSRLALYGELLYYLLYLFVCTISLVLFFLFLIYNLNLIMLICRVRYVFRFLNSAILRMSGEDLRRNWSSSSIVSFSCCSDWMDIMLSDQNRIPLPLQ